MTRSLKIHSRWTPKRCFALLTGLWLLLQVSGVQQLCFCGSCAVSQVMAQWLPVLAHESHPGSDSQTAADGHQATGAEQAAQGEHPCCAAARLAEEQEQSKLPNWASEGDCGCDQETHSAQAFSATVEPDHGTPAAAWALALEGPARDATLVPGSARAWSASLARGPPGLPPTDLYLTHRRLLI